jgi:hypothetical protein
VELFAIFAMTSFAFAVFGLLIVSSQNTNLYSIRNLFMAVWLYYGFSIGIDLLTGVELPYTPGEAYMMDPSTWGSVGFVMWNYVICGIAFLIAYTVLGTSSPCVVDRKYNLRLPPTAVLIAVNLLAAATFYSIFFDMSRMERMSMASTSPMYKFAGLLIPMVLALDIVVIVSGQDRKALTAFVAAVLVALITGNRNYVLIAFTVAAFRWRPALRGWKLVGMAVACGAVVFMFKTAYAVGQGWLLGEKVDLAMIHENLQFSLSGLDAGASYVIAIFYTQQDSPWWLGESYLLTPLYMTWPRFLGGMGVSTLAEDYIWSYHPRIASQGGAMAFSAIAEAWLNFSYAGSMLLGAFWGAVARFFDSRPRGIGFYIVLLMVIRIFRSDFATLYKNWGLVWGTLFVLILLVLTAYTVLSRPSRPLARQPSRSNPTKVALSGEL